MRPINRETFLPFSWNLSRFMLNTGCAAALNSSFFLSLSVWVTQRLNGRLTTVHMKPFWSRACLPVNIITFIRQMAHFWHNNSSIKCHVYINHCSTSGRIGQFAGKCLAQRYTGQRDASVCMCLCLCCHSSRRVSHQDFPVVAEDLKCWLSWDKKTQQTSDLRGSSLHDTNQPNEATNSSASNRCEQKQSRQ